MQKKLLTGAPHPLPIQRTLLSQASITDSTSSSLFMLYKAMHMYSMAHSVISIRENNLEDIIASL